MAHAATAHTHRTADVLVRQNCQEICELREKGMGILDGVKRDIFFSQDKKRKDFRVMESLNVSKKYIFFSIKNSCFVFRLCLLFLCERECVCESVYHVSPVPVPVALFPQVFKIILYRACETVSQIV
jgi:hypothetical protein